jgi:hypothetical protein
MKSILRETVLIGEAIAFCGVALLAAVVVFPAIALWETIGAELKGGKPSATARQEVYEKFKINPI